LPRFFGITKTLRPVFREPDAAAVEEEEAAGDEAAADVAGVVVVVDEEEEDDEQAARAGATNKSGRASHVARLSLIVCILSIFGWMCWWSLLAACGHEAESWGSRRLLAGVWEACG
jgi:hypothetical protein